MKTVSLFLLPWLVCSAGSALYADSAAWALDPGSGSWVTATNWTPNTVPNGPADTATFGISNVTSVSLPVDYPPTAVEVYSVVFASEASAYTISADGGVFFSTLTFSGTGIINNSGIVQNFRAFTESGFGGGRINFINSASAGSLTMFTSSHGRGAISFGDTSNAGNATFLNQGGTNQLDGPSFMFFGGNSTADHGVFTNGGGGYGSSIGAQVYFSGNATAGDAVFTNQGSLDMYYNSGGRVTFSGTSTAGNGTFTNNGGAGPGAGPMLPAGGITQFLEDSTADNGVLIANGSPPGGTGSEILFADNSSGGTARVEVFGDGLLDISAHAGPGVTIGSLEGTGNVFLGANSLTIGSRNISTVFSGVIQDGGDNGGTGGSLTKIGTGTLTLSGANTYTGPTVVSSGKLVINGSVTSNVTVSAPGRLGGSGTINGHLINGGPIIGPGGVVHPGDPQTLTVNGDYDQGNGGTLELSIAGTAFGSYDRLVVAGAITLTDNAVLQLDFINGFAPHAGDTFDLVSYSSLSGSFSSVDVEGLQPGFQYNLASDGAGNFELTALNDAIAVPEPITAVILLVGGFVMLAHTIARRAGHQ